MSIQGQVASMCSIRGEINKVQEEISVIQTDNHFVKKPLYYVFHTTTVLLYIIYPGK